MKKSNIFLFIFLINIILVSIISFNTYNNFSTQFESTQNIIQEVHKQDSLLYRQLLISDVASLADFEDQRNNNQIIQEIFNLKTSSSNQEDSINTYLSLEELRKEIVTLHKFHLENPLSNYNAQLQEQLNEYEDRQREVISSVEEISNQMSNSLKNSLITIIIIILITSFIQIYLLKNILKNKKDKTNTVDIFLDNQSKEILDFIKLKIDNNFHPTIKDIKKEFNLTHPTILSKLKKLEDSELIVIKKDGRNKNIFLK